MTDRAVRRTADTTKGIAATVASAVPMAGEMTTQGVKDIRATQKNEAALDKELESDARGKELKDLITAVDMDYNPQYTDEDLRGMGYNQSEIDTMRSRIAGTVQKTALDKDTSLGYQLYNYGQQRTAAAQTGMSPAAKTAMGVATSAAENLAVAGVSPYLVLPVLSAQGAAESMGQDMEKGASAGQAVGVGLAKFGAGWAINSVGVADMARSMGVDYARDTVAGKLADLVRSSKLVSGLGNSQLAANTISGGVDNAVQAFVETYADKIIDATLGGDQQAADELLQSDTFLQALQSGLTGGASGALGGAVGTGLGAMSRTLDARAGMETAAPVQVDTESRAAQRALEERAMEPGEAARQQADQAAAVQQTGNTDAAETTARKDAAPAVRSENSAVQQLAAALQADNLTGKTINLFTPNAANEANRAAFAEEYGMELPATASETRKALRTLAQQTQQQAAEVPDTNVGNNAAQMESPAADQHQSAVEKAGETVESPAEYADVELRADPAALETDSWTRGEQVQTAQELAQHYRMSTQAVQTVVNNMPAGIGAEIYAPAAASLYRLGVNGEGASFAEALQMTGKGSALSGRVQQVLALGNAGRTALELAYTQGKGEAERYGETKAAELGKQPGKAALRDDAGTYYKADGSVSKGARADDALIELSAKASGVAAQRVVQGLANNAKGLIQSAAGKVFYSGDADAATVMHETLHELNRWDNAGGQELIDTFEHYLVQQNGMDSVQELVQSYLDRYERAGQQLTYNQAVEEITADAMRSIFGTEEDFRNYVRQQAAEARMNAQAQKRSNRVMQKIETLLQKVLTDIKTLLGAEPDNAAARAARTLTETQLKDLRQIYFNHQADAGTNYRAALEANGGMEKAAAADAAAAEGERYSIDPDYAEKIDEWDKDGRSDDETFVLGSTGDTLQGLGARESDIYMNSDKINRILHDHPEMTLNEIKRIPEVLDDPVMVLTSQNKGRSQQNTRLVMFGSVKAKDGRPVMCILDLRPVENHIVINDMQKLTSAYTKDTNPVQFVRDSEVLYASENKKRTTALTVVP